MDWRQALHNLKEWILGYGRRHRATIEEHLSEEMYVQVIALFRQFERENPEIARMEIYRTAKDYILAAIPELADTILDRVLGED